MNKGPSTRLLAVQGPGGNPPKFYLDRGHSTKRLAEQWSIPHNFRWNIFIYNLCVFSVKNFVFWTIHCTTLPLHLPNMVTSLRYTIKTCSFSVVPPVPMFYCICAECNCCTTIRFPIFLKFGLEYCLEYCLKQVPNQFEQK